MVRIIILAASLLLLASCMAPSVHPFYTEKDLAPDPGLAGVWQNRDGRWRLICKPADAAGYLCEVMGKGAGSATFQVHRFRLGGGIYLDSFPEAPSMAHLFLQLHLVLGHVLVRVDRQGDVLSIALLDDDWVKKNAGRAAAYLPPQKDATPVLYAPTRQLQELVLAASADPKSFAKPEEYRRVK
jgi:hypothetical protein